MTAKESRIVACKVVVILIAVAFGFAPTPGQQQQSIDDFFRDFSADWVRHNPTQATATHYFSGNEQDQLERQLTPFDSREWQLYRLKRAKQGLAELGKFDRSRMSGAQKISADVMQWQLENTVGNDAYRDYTFPLEQFQGANVSLVNNLTVTRTIRSQHDAENYVVVLGEVGARMKEAMDVARREEAEGIVPPRFILQATVKQMQDFIAPPPAQNVFVTTYNQKMMAVSEIAPDKREELRATAEKAVNDQVYPSCKDAIALLQSQLVKSTDRAGLWRLKG